jgi:hypothetical protein
MEFSGKAGALTFGFSLDTPADLTVSLQVDDGAVGIQNGANGQVSFTTGVLTANLHMITYVLSALTAVPAKSDLTISVTRAADGAGLKASPTNDPKGNPFMHNAIDVNTSFAEIIGTLLT